MVRQGFTQRGVPVMDDIAVGRTMTAAALELGQAASPADIAAHAGRQDDQGKGCVEKEDRDKGCNRDAAHDIILERA